MQTSSPLQVSLVAIPDAAPSCLYGLYEVLSSVGVVWQQLTGEPEEGRRIEARFVGFGREIFTGFAGAPIKPHAAFEEVRSCDVVIVPDLHFPLDEDPAGRWDDLAPWLHAQVARGATVASVCTGAALLAATGVLSGHAATTHWGIVDVFRRHFPDVELRPERILIASGPDDRVVTTGGAASWEDLALYLIGRYCGQVQAVHAAKIFLIGDRSEGQLPYAAMTRPRRHEDAAVARSQAWIADNYACTNAVRVMAAESGLSDRTFKRRFRAATGYAPIDYVQTLRIEEAKQMLETSERATDLIARDVGYDDPSFFRRLFKRRTGLTPARYRQRYRMIARP